MKNSTCLTSCWKQFISWSHHVFCNYTSCTRALVLSCTVLIHHTLRMPLPSHYDHQNILPFRKSSRYHPTPCIAQGPTHDKCLINVGWTGAASSMKFALTILTHIAQDVFSNFFIQCQIHTHLLIHSTDICVIITQQDLCSSWGMKEWVRICFCPHGAYSQVKDTDIHQKITKINVNL